MRSSSAFAWMISSETCRPSAFEPMVLISRFISCSRKSSLRPHGSGAGGQRVPVREVPAKARHLFGDVRALRDAHDLLRDRVRIAGRDDQQLLHPLREPRLQVAPALVGRRGKPAD